MGFYTQLILNDIQVPGQRLQSHRASACEILGNRECSWSYMLKYAYVESSENEIIDLQLSKEMKQQLTAVHGKPQVPLSKAVLAQGQGEADEPWYIVAWDPFVVGSAGNVGSAGKWYGTEEFACWLAGFCVCGQLFQLSAEGGGGLWGWEFQGDGNSRMVASVSWF